jgi:hypothetical protein
VVKASSFIEKRIEALRANYITPAALFVFTSLCVAGCMNMPTPTSQITGSQTSRIKYENLDCSRLATEMDSLTRQENELTVAQEQRIKTSQMQAFWWGFGQGDGIEASELANVRGDKEAVQTAMETKKCK